MKQLLVLCLAVLPLLAMSQTPTPTPDQLYGELFKEVQLQKIFPDGKTFVDCVPKRPVKDIMYDYGMMKGPNFDLKKFVEENFDVPVKPQSTYVTKEKDAATHIKNLWNVLKRPVDKPVEGSSLLPLPNSYIVPGGRFREIYYWDSYFTMLGLKESGEFTLMDNMLKNFAYLIDTYGHIPNGNRSYYLSRSQPPFFSMMVELLASKKGNGVYKTYLPAMKKEYDYWMAGAADLKDGTAGMRVIKTKDGFTLNRYWDEGTTPRQESYKEDYETSEAVANELAMRIKVSSPEALEKILAESKAKTNANLRAGAASGWDFSSRWFSDEKSIKTIQTTDIIPVDLNCLMYAIEMNISKASRIGGDIATANAFQKKADQRKAAILKYCWNKSTGFFHDYNSVTEQQNTMVTAAGLFPLFVKIATPKQATAVAATAKKTLVKSGGLVTTPNQSGQQWDSPNGWAPLQWVAVAGLNNYGQKEVAAAIGRRWLVLNDRVFAATGKMMEKYNVEDITKIAGGGEYPSQDGFGWTNGVYLALKKLYPPQAPAQLKTGVKQ